MSESVSITISASYGVEFSGGRATVARARRRSGGVDVEMIARGMDTASDPAWKQIAATMKDEQSRGHAIVNVFAPAQDSFVRPIEAPFGSIRKANAVLASLLDVELPFPLEQCSYEFIRVEQTAENRVRALALAMPQDRLQKLLGELAGADLDPESVEPEALVLWRMAGMDKKAAAPRPVIILYLAADRTVAVAGSGGIPIASFSTRSPWTVASGDPAREKLGNRLQQFLAGVLRSHADVGPLYIVGGECAAAVGDDLRERLGVEADAWHVPGEPAESFARALATGGLHPGPWSGNLRGGSMTHPNLLRLRERMQNRMMTMVAAAAIALMVIASVGAQATKGRHERLQQELQREAKALTGLDAIPRGQELMLAENHIKQSAPGDEALLRWQSAETYALFSGVLRTAYARNILLEDLSVKSGGAVIRGAATDWNDADLLAAVFAGAGWKADVERSDAGQDERVHFTLKAQP